MFLKVSILHRYVLAQLLNIFLISLFAITSLFLVFDFFDRSRTFIKEGSTFFQLCSYLFFKIPEIVHLMTPIALLVATLIAIGRLSQLSEITAMRACGTNLFWLAQPLLLFGLIVSLSMFLAGETIIPWSAEKVDQIYDIQVKKKLEKGRLSRDNFWYRSGNKFYSIGEYDSRQAVLKSITILQLDNSFHLSTRIDAAQATWTNISAGWTMKNITETHFNSDGSIQTASYSKLPLVISEKPHDFYLMRRSPETMNYASLKAYIEKLKAEGVPVNNYLTELASKISFPFVNFIVILIAFPFALISARKGKTTANFIAGVSAAFAYYFIHAFTTALANAELLPILAGAWAANIILFCFAGYKMAGIESN